MSPRVGGGAVEGATRRLRAIRHCPMARTWGPLPPRRSTSSSASQRRRWPTTISPAPGARCRPARPPHQPLPPPAGPSRLPFSQPQSSQPACLIVGGAVRAGFCRAAKYQSILGVRLLGGGVCAGRAWQRPRRCAEGQRRRSGRLSWPAWSRAAHWRLGSPFGCESIGS